MAETNVIKKFIQRTALVFPSMAPIPDFDGCFTKVVMKQI